MNRLTLTGLALTTSLLVSSCATLFRSNTTVVEVHTRPDSARVVVAETGSVVRAPAAIALLRREEPYALDVIAGNDTQRVTLRSGLGAGYWLGNLATGFPVSHLVDLGTDRRLDFEDEVFVDLHDSSRSFPNWRSGMFEPGDIRLGAALNALTMTYVAVIALDTGGGVWHTGTPFLAAGATFDYFTHRTRFLRADARALTSIGGECFGNCPPTLVQFSAALQRGHLLFLNQLQMEIGYGLRYSANIVKYHPDSLPAPPDRSVPTLGLALLAGIRLSNAVAILVEYSPSVVVDGDSFGGRYSYDVTFRLQFSTARSEPKGWDGPVESGAE